VFQTVINGEVAVDESFEFPLLTRRGEKRDILWYHTILKGETGEIIGVLSSGEDISDRKNAEKILKQAKDKLEEQTIRLAQINMDMQTLCGELEMKNKELQRIDQSKSDFLSMVSHELRTPLTIIRETVSQVLDGIQGDTTPEQREFLSMCLEGVDRLSRIINDLLDLSKIEANKFEIKREMVNIADVVKELQVSFFSRLKERGVELKVNLSAGQAAVYADRDSLVQVFTNLIGNASKFTESGFISISVVDKDNCLEFAVVDTGGGIAEEDLPKVFDKFEQFRRDSATGEKGTGLGLPIVKGIVELHNGKVWVESKLNQGSKFIFTLPKYKTREFFKENVADVCKKAKKNEKPFSLLRFDIKEEPGQEESSPPDKAYLLEELNKIIDTALSGTKNVVVVDNYTLLVILINSKKDDTLFIADKIREEFNRLSAVQRGGKIKCFYTAAAFPEDGDNEKDLVAIINEQ
ncbi:MAG: HAMP domain-containing sensor histidine kinase, partial [Candidatus Omnitrophota bacterium]